MFKSKKTSVSTTTANQNSAGISENSGTAAQVSGSGNVMNVTDGGAISGAFSFLDGANAADTERLKLVLDHTERFATEAQQTAQKGAADSVAAVVGAFKSEQTPNRDVAMLGIVAASIVAAVVFMKR